MKYFDESKGVVDYCFEALPLLTLVFMIFAYIHTIHPIFEKSQELEEIKSKQKITQSENQSLKSRNIQLDDGIDQLNSKIVFLEAKLLEHGGENFLNTFYSTGIQHFYRKKDVIGNYIKIEGDILTELGSYVNQIHVNEIDINNDGQLDLFITSSGYCGSSGCTGYLYLADKGSYCFSSMLHSKSIGLDTSQVVFKCRNIKEKIWLGDLINKEGS